jgi:type II secretory pathway pseudopilin PulG
MPFSPLPRISCQRAMVFTGRSASGSGFTLVEMVIAGSLMAVVLGGAAAALLVANRSSSRQGGLSELESLIDQDLAAIQALDRRFSCCTGSPCTANAATIAAATTCRDAGGVARGPGNENYYSPRQSPTAATAPAAEATAWTNFSTACGNGTIASTFQGLLPSLPTPQLPATLNRTTEVIDNAANRLQLTYTGAYQGSNVTTRVVNLIPTAANWCP